MQESPQNKIKELLKLKFSIQGETPDIVFNKILQALDADKAKWSKLNKSESTPTNIFNSRSGFISLWFRLSRFDGTCQEISINYIKYKPKKSVSDTVSFKIQGGEISNQELKYMRHFINQYRNKLRVNEKAN